MIFINLMKRAKKGDETAVYRIIGRFKYLIKRELDTIQLNMQEEEEFKCQLVLALLIAINKFDFNYRKK